MSVKQIKNVQILLAVLLALAWTISSLPLIPMMVVLILTSVQMERTLVQVQTEFVSIKWERHLHVHVQSGTLILKLKIVAMTMMSVRHVCLRQETMQTAHVIITFQIM